jgi:hypothetical protein
MLRMRSVTLAISCAAMMAVSCGKKEEAGGGDAGAGGREGDGRVASHIGETLTAKGFRILQQRAAPSQRSGSNAVCLTYRAADGKSGGVYYVFTPIESGSERVGWHWHFDSNPPDSAAFMEINHDGLWDARVYRGKDAVDQIQGEDFWLFLNDHAGTVSLNGPASAPGVWKCFDGDSTSSWTSKKSEAFVDFANPVGLDDGELIVRLGQSNRPRSVDVLLGDRKLQSFPLEDNAGRQRFTMDPASKNAEMIRLEFDGGSGDEIEISELEIR